MTTSLLYHAFCVRSHSLLRTEYRDGSVYAHLQKKRYARRCAACQHPGVTLEGGAEVKVRTLPIGKRSVCNRARASCAGDGCLAELAGRGLVELESGTNSLRCAPRATLSAEARKDEHGASRAIA